MTGTPATLTTTRPWTAREVAGALFQHFTRQGYAVLNEVEARPDESYIDALRKNQMVDQAELATLWSEKRPRRVDVLAVRAARKPGIGPVELLAIEIKVTRADFLADVRDPHKQARWRDLTHRMAYAVPEGLVRSDEVPDGCGLIEVFRHQQGDWRTAEWSKRATFGDLDLGVPNWLAMTFAHRASWAEGRVKGFLSAQSTDDPDELRAQVERLKADLERSRAAAERERGMHLGWKEAYATANGVPCAFCGEEIRPRVNSGGMTGKWFHRKKVHDEPCQAIRDRQGEDAARHAWENHADEDRDYRRSSLRMRSTRHQYPEGEEWRAFVYVSPVMPAEPTQEDQETPEDDDAH